MATREITLDDLIIPKYDDLLQDILDHKHRHYVVHGGRGSTKSTFIPLASVMLLTQPQNSKVHALFMRKVGSTVRSSIYNQTVKAIGLLGLESEFKCTINPLQIVYRPTGQKIYFSGLDDASKIKSISPEFGYIGITFFEEADQFNGMVEIRKVLQSTMRGSDDWFANFMAYNPPRSAAHWINKEMATPREDRLIVKADYRDVPIEWLGREFIEEAAILKQINEREYQHEYLGIPVGTGANVFENVIVREITDEEIQTFDNPSYGFDPGWSEAFGFVECYYDTNKQIIYIFGEKYGYHTKREQIAELLSEYKGVSAITMDSADPELRFYLIEQGLPMLGAVKGVDSRRKSYDWMASRVAIVIDPVRCPNCAREFVELEFQKAKDGTVTSVIPKVNDHCIDGCRYAIESIWRMNVRH